MKTIVTTALCLLLTGSSIALAEDEINFSKSSFDYYAYDPEVVYNSDFGQFLISFVGSDDYYDFFSTSTLYYTKYYFFDYGNENSDYVRNITEIPNSVILPISTNVNSLAYNNIDKNYLSVNAVFPIMQNSELSGVYINQDQYSNTTVGNEFNIASSAALINPEVTFDDVNNQYLVTVHDDEKLVGNFIDSNENISSAFTIDNFSFEYAIEFDGTNYLLTWDKFKDDESESTINGQLISAAGELIGASFEIYKSTTEKVTDSSIVFDGSNYLVAWESESIDGNEYSINAQLINGTGELVGTPIQVTTSSDTIEHNATLAFDGSNYLVAWESKIENNDNGVIKIQRLTNSGDLFGLQQEIGNSFEIFSSLGITPKIAYDSSLEDTFLIVWEGLNTQTYYTHRDTSILGKMVSGSTSSIITDAMEVFDQNWYEWDFINLLRLFKDADVDGNTSAGRNSWYYSDVDYNTSGLWGDAHSIGSAWIDENSFKHININGKGLSTQAKEWRVLSEINTYNVFDIDWNKNQIDLLHDVFQDKDGYKYIAGEKWYYSDVDYNTSGLWGDAHSIGSAWIDENGFKHMNLNGDGLTSQPIQWTYLAEIDIQNIFNIDWDTTEIDLLNQLFDQQSGEITIDDITWYFNDVDYDESGAWGIAQNPGEIWMDKYGFLHINLYNGKGLTTSDKPVEWDILAKAGYTYDIGDSFGINWDKTDVDMLYQLYLDSGGSLVVDGETWYYTPEEFEGHSIGDYWIEDGIKYIYIGSGITTRAPFSVPEPTTLVLLLLGSIAFSLKKRRA